jgi:predicted nucleic acid-binding protein
MERLMYLLDTNAVADYINQFEPTVTRIDEAIRHEHQVYLCQPVYYEVLRGLIKTNATRKRHIFENEFVPQLPGLALTDVDWHQAAQFWADTVKVGKQLADTDLLIAALAKRLNGVIVTADNDFDVLPIQRENWRIPMPDEA